MPTNDKWLLVLAAAASCKSGGPRPSELLDGKRAEMAALVEPVRKKVATLAPLADDRITGVDGPLI